MSMMNLIQMTKLHQKKKHSRARPAKAKAKPAPKAVAAGKAALKSKAAGKSAAEAKSKSKARKTLIEDKTTTTLKVLGDKGIVFSRNGGIL